MTAFVPENTDGKVLPSGGVPVKQGLAALEDEEFEAQMTVAKRIMRENHDLFRRLSKA